MAGLTWSLLDWIKFGKPTTLGMITGAVAGLVAITPAAGFVTPMGAICIGIGAGVIPWLIVTYLKSALGYDDSLDAFGVHGVGGIWGAIATGLFATKAVNPAGGGRPVLRQPGAAVDPDQGRADHGSLLVRGLAGAAEARGCGHGLRVSEHEERVGLDLTQHREAAYTVID